MCISSGKTWYECGNSSDCILIYVLGVAWKRQSQTLRTRYTRLFPGEMACRRREKWTAFSRRMDLSLPDRHEATAHQ